MLRHFLAAVSLFLLAAPLPASERFPIDSNNVVRPLSSANAVLIPVAGSVPGGFGTFFRSEITIINFAPETQLVELRWLPGAGEGGAAEQALRISIPAASGLSSDDFVVDVMRRTGIGAITVTAINADGSLAELGMLQVTSRIYTKMPGSEGTVSQTFPSVPLSVIAAADRQLFPSTMRLGGQYRMNVGVVNLSTAPQSYLVTIATGVGSARVSEQFTVDVPARALRQVNLPTTLQGNAQVAIENVTAVGRSGSWLSYTSNVDNISGDAWSFLGFNQPVR
jgi:hypothetical protein